MSVPEKIPLSELSRGDLEALTERLLAENAALKQAVAELRAEIAKLKGVTGRPAIRPSGMEQKTEPKSMDKAGKRGVKQRKTEQLVIDEERVIKADVPAGSRFKGYEDFIVQDLVLRPHVVRIRRERWLTPDGQTILAPMPAGVAGHFGPELRRFVLLQYHQGQVTMPRLVTQLRAIGIVISKRQVVRLLNADTGPFVDEARAVLRAGLETAPWISVDDTGARHKHRNGYCTQVGNDHFAAFTTTASKSRLNFLEVLRAGYADYVINAEALAYMRQRALAGRSSTPWPTIRTGTSPMRRRGRIISGGSASPTWRQSRPGPHRHRRRAVGRDQGPWAAARHRDRVRRCRAVRDRGPRLVPSRRGCCHPRPSQTRTCRFPAFGSSGESFAHSSVAMDNPGWR